MELPSPLDQSYLFICLSNHVFSSSFYPFLYSILYVGCVDVVEGGMSGPYNV